MRIVAGKYRGRTLLEFSGDEIRPTADKVRESLFNIIQNRTAGSVFLDLYCGTGAMGIEALSRYAKSVVFNDISKNSLALVKKNIEKIKVVDEFEISNCDAVRYLTTTNKKFDIIFIDPPYKSEQKKDSLSYCSLVLNDNGIVIFEDETEWQGEVDGLIAYNKRKYGRVHLTFFKKEEK